MLRSRVTLAAALAALLPLAVPAAQATHTTDNNATITRLVPVTAEDPEGVDSGPMPDTGWQFWPNPYDELTPNQMRVDFIAETEGTYRVLALRNSWIYGESEPIALAAGSTSSWTWDGLDFLGDVAERGSYRFQVMKLNDRGRYGEASPRSETFELRNSVGTVYGPDKDNERGTGDLDVDRFRLINAPGATTVELDFRSQRFDRSLGSFSVGIDVNASKRGYLFSGRREDGQWSTRLAYVLLASDSNRYEYIRCPKATISTVEKTLTGTVPRSCMPHGGKKARIYFSIVSKDYRSYDYGPDRGATGDTGYYSESATWTEEPPA